MPDNPWQIVQVKLHTVDIRRLNELAMQDKTSAGYQIRFAVGEYLAQRKSDLEKPKNTKSGGKVVSIKSKK